MEYREYSEEAQRRQRRRETPRYVMDFWDRTLDKIELRTCTGDSIRVEMMQEHPRFCRNSQQMGIISSKGARIGEFGKSDLSSGV